MTASIRVLLDGRVETIAGIDPTTTVLQWLRATGRVGTKEGCAEGDCGACTVVVGTLEDGRVRYRAANACILFLPMLDGRQLITVESLKGADGELHPVQQALVDAHASQCGFCTPGFVMSLFAMYHADEPAGREEILDGLAGNLCRCTGYRPILDAARAALGDRRDDSFSAGEAATAAKLAELVRSEGLAYRAAGKRWFAPASVAELEVLLGEHPDAVLLAGATDVGLWVTKQHRRLDPVIWLGQVRELREIVADEDCIRIGAGVTYAQALPLLAARWPSFADLVRRIGSAQIRNAGTIGGNIANASPIGDSMPALIALGAEIVLNRAGQRRTFPLEDYFLAYRRTALAEGEFVEQLILPARPEGRFATYKISKRRDQDISAIAAGFRVILDGTGRVREARLAFGGMAATPKRAMAAEAALEGRPWTLDAATAAAAALGQDFTPLTDMRASADYRLLTARNLLVRFYLETTGQGEALEGVDHA